MDKKTIQKIVAEVMQEAPDAKNIKSISLFGSFLHGDNNDKSDIDLLFEMNKTMSLFEIGGIHYQLEQKFGRRVDFVPKNSVIRQLRDKIIPEAEKIYERK